MESQASDPKNFINSLSSVKIARGQKGAYGWEVKVYDKNPEIAMSKCLNIESRLKETFIVKKRLNLNSSASTMNSPVTLKSFAQMLRLKE